MSDTTSITAAAAGVQVSFHSELMKNYAPQLPVSATHQIEALQADETPWVFSVGTDDTLYAITRKEGVGTGWVQHPLSAGMGTVTAFGSVGDGTDGCRLGMAVRQDGVSRFYLGAVTQLSTSMLEQFDPGTFWTEHALPDTSATVNQVRVDGGGALIATTKTGNDALYYTVDDTGVKPYTLPEDGATVLGLSLGTVYGDRGVFLLYTVGEAQTLLFQSFPDPVYRKTSKYRYVPPQGAMADFALLPSSSGTNAVIAVGDAVTLFTTPDDTPQVVAAPTAGLSLTSVRVAQKKSAISLWFLGEKEGLQSLYYLTNQFYQGSTATFTEKWTAPIPLRQEVGRFAPLRGEEVSNHLFLVSQTNTLVHFWQDQATTLWQAAEIPVHDTGKAIPVDTYTLHVQFSSSGLRGNLAGKTVTVTSSSALYVEMNGIGYRLGPAAPGAVPLDANGILNVVNVTDSIAAPVLTIAADFLDAPVNVDLMHIVRDRLGSVSSGSDLSKATRYDPDSNTQVPLTSGQPADVLDHIAQSVAQLRKATNNMKTPQSPADRAVRRAFAAMARPAPGTSQSFALSFTEGGGVQFYQGAAAEMHFAARVSAAAGRVGVITDANAVDFSAPGSWDGLGHAFGDVVEWIGNAIDDVNDFRVQVTEDVVHFAIRVGDTLHNFILTTAQEVFAAVEWLFKKIALFLKELIEWLGFLFAWKDILHTRTALKQMFNGGLSAFQDNAQKVKKEFDGWVGRVLTKDLRSPELANRLRGTTGQTVDGSAGQVGGLPLGQADPRIQWVMSRLPALGGGDGASGSATPDGVLGDILGRITSLAGDFATEYDKVSQLGEDWANGKITTADFAIGVLDALGALALDMMQRIVDGILDAVSEIVQSVSDLMNESIDFPFFSGLYELVTQDKPSVLDVLCLVLAIPVTVAYKLLTKAAPFRDGHGQALIDAPAKAFASFSLDGSSGERFAATGLGASDNAVVVAVITGVIRLLRSGTFSLVTAAAMTGQPPGTTGVLALDHFLRMVGVFAAFGTVDPTVLKTITLMTFTVLFLITLTLYDQQKKAGAARTFSVSTPQRLAGKLGKNFNIGGAIDAACVMAIGIWHAVGSRKKWDEKSKAKRASEVLNQIFRIPALVGFFANTIARNSGDNPYAMAAAILLASIRAAGLRGSAISEGVVAKTG